MSALKPTRRVADSRHLDHTATQHWVDRQSPHGPVPVPTSGPPRWARWRCDRSSSSQERIEASLHWKRLLVESFPTCSQKLTHRPCSLRPWCSPAAHQRSVYSGGDHNRGAQTAKHSTGSLAMMLLGHGSDGEPQVYAQLGQHPPRRTTVSAPNGARGLSPV